MTDKVLEGYKLLKLTHEETGKLNSSVSMTEITFVVENLPTKEAMGPRGFTSKFYQTHNEEIIPILQKVFLEMKEYFPTDSTMPELIHHN